MALDVEFGVKNLCGLGVSPAMTLSPVPDGTARWRVKLTNIDALIQTPWEETLPATGATIAEGAAANYVAPCPGDTRVFRYRTEVMALDAEGRALAHGMAVRPIASLASLARTRGPVAPPPSDPLLDTLRGRVHDPLETPLDRR
jgi:hypothetical protein